MNLRFKVGDKVQVKASLYGHAPEFEGKTVTILEAREASQLYRIEEDNKKYWWVDMDFVNLSDSEGPSKAEKHATICTLLNETFIAKNHDYGDSFSKQYKKHGIVAPAIRIEEKFERFNNLITKDSKVKSESIEDTLLDMANYCIMTLVEMGLEKENNNG